MKLPERINKYFSYEDRLRRNISIITGIFIVLFNIISGFMLIQIAADILLGIKNPGTDLLLLYIIPGIAAGAVLLKLCVFMIEFFLSGIEIEEYSYLRMVLLVTIAAYFIILFFYILVILSSLIERKYLGISLVSYLNILTIINII